MFRGHSKPARPWKNAPKRCKMKGDLDNVVLIDVDNETSQNVIIIDIPETLQEKFQRPRVPKENEKDPFNNVISLDDDESTDNDHLGVGVEGCTDLDSDTSSSKRSHPTFNYSHSSVGSDGDECQFIWERKSPVKLSKCKRTYSGKPPCRNRYGLSPESDTDTSEGDCSDCEVMEGSLEKLREQWKEASSKRRYNVRNMHSGVEDQASASSSPAEEHPDVEVKNSSELHPDVPLGSCSSSENCENENPFVATADANLGGTPLTSDTGFSFPQSDWGNDQECFSHWKAEFTETGKYFNGKGRSCLRGQMLSEDFSFNKAGPRFQFDFEEYIFQQHTSWLNQDWVDNHRNNVKNFQAEERTSSADPCLFNSKPSLNVPYDKEKANVQDKQASSSNSPQQSETQVDFDRVVRNKDEEDKAVRNKDEEFYPEHSCCDARSDKLTCKNKASGVEEKAVTGESVIRNARTSEESHFTGSTSPCEDEVGPVPGDTPSWSNVTVEENSVCRGKEKTASPECSTKHIETQHGALTPAFESDIINERERLKETEEYKRATEEEWASRLRQLQIQAEEAQRLRKRRRAESMRLLDMERRQQLRVEEVRATQKKDEENMNLKEQLRIELRKELSKLEMTCPSMASLLRGLGIRVEGGVFPLPEEVQAAYKRALLRFHPDRAPRNNIRQQVEAEEKFKLISRMKEKF